MQENGGVSGKRVEATLQRDFEGFSFKGKERNKMMFEGVFKMYGRKMKSLRDCLNRKEKHDAGGGETYQKDALEPQREGRGSCSGVGG